MSVPPATMVNPDAVGLALPAIAGLPMSWSAHTGWAGDCLAESSAFEPGHNRPITTAAAMHHLPTRTRIHSPPLVRRARALTARTLTDSARTLPAVEKRALREFRSIHACSGRIVACVRHDCAYD